MQGQEEAHSDSLEVKILREIFMLENTMITCF